MKRAVFLGMILLPLMVGGFRGAVLDRSGPRPGLPACTSCENCMSEEKESGHTAPCTGGSFYSCHLGCNTEQQGCEGHPQGCTPDGPSASLDREPQLYGLIERAATGEAEAVATMLRHWPDRVMFNVVRNAVQVRPPCGDPEILIAHIPLTASQRLAAGRVTGAVVRIALHE